MKREAGHQVKKTFSLPYEGSQLQAGAANAVSRRLVLVAPARDRLARLDAQRELIRAPVDLVALAADAVHDARALSPDRPVTFELAHHERVPVVLGDESRLRQVLGNLMSNALTHTPAGTPVTIGVTTEPGWAVLSVADQGPGLPPQDAQRVFERFYRADTSRTRSRGGTGLGLSIVAALTAAHGGVVDLDTTPGTGAVFLIRLPLAT